MLLAYSSFSRAFHFSQGESKPSRTDEHTVLVAPFSQYIITPNCFSTASLHAERSQLQVLGHWMPEAPEGPKTLPGRHLPYAPHQPHRPVPVHSMHGDSAAILNSSGV